MKEETQKLANILRNARYLSLIPEDLARYLLNAGYSRTALTFELGLDKGRAFEAAVKEAVELVKEP